MRDDEALAYWSLHIKSGTGAVYMTIPYVDMLHIKRYRCNETHVDSIEYTWKYFATTQTKKKTSDVFYRSFHPWPCRRYIVYPRYNAAICVHISHKRCPIARPWWRGVGWLWEVRVWAILYICYYVVVFYAIQSYIGPRRIEGLQHTYTAQHTHTPIIYMYMKLTMKNVSCQVTRVHLSVHNNQYIIQITNAQHILFTQWFITWQRGLEAIAYEAQ